MTIVGYEPSRTSRALHRAMGALVTDDRDPFWDDVKRNVAAWLIITGIAGVGYMAVSIPSRMDRIILNQDAFREDVRGLQNDVGSLKERITALELHQGRRQ